MYQGIFLGFQKIPKQRAGGDDTAAIVPDTKPFHRAHMEMLRQRPVAEIVVEIPGFQGRNGNMQAASQILQVNAADQKGVVADDFRRHELVDFIQQLPLAVHLRQETVPGGHIGHRHAVPVLHADNGHQVIIFSLIQPLGIQIGAGGHHPGHLPLHHAFGGFRILHLLADGHLVPLLNETTHIGLRRVIRHAAHGRPLLKAALLSGQGQLQFPGHRHRVLEKHFIEIAQPVKQNTVLVFLLCCYIMLHHW